MLLAPVKSRLRACRHVGRETEHLRLEVLEAAASQLGGWSLDVYRRATNDDYETTSATALAEAGPILTALGETTVPPALALCSLARPDLARVDRRKIGVYYTDFRLSQYLAGRVAESLTAASTVPDPSSGRALLAAVVLAVCGADRDKLARMIGGGIAAADLSEAALRGAG